MIGLLDGITDPEVMARVAERQRIIARVVEQMGVTRERAIEALDDFASNLCHEGLTLH
jgi:NACalpha-BTF3-like transcription factor